MKATAPLLLLFAAACAHSPIRRNAACAPTRDSVPLTLSDSDAARLAGEYELIQVTTSDSSNSAWRTHLSLRVPDTAERRRATERHIGHRPRKALQLVGEWDWQAGRPAEDAEMDGGVLFLGCRDCLDGSPYHLVVTARTATGFTGEWKDYQTGIAYVTDKRGRRLPDPAGYFCAVRR